MKPFFCLVILSLALLQTSAQNVGIGITTPASKLTIAHTSSLTDPTLGLVDLSSTGGARISFSNSGGNNGWFITGIVDNGTPANSFLKFSYNNDMSPTLTIRGNGNTGINQSAPAFPLDVTGDINLTGRLRINGAAGTVGQILISNGVSPPTWQTIAIGFSAKLNGSVSLSSGMASNLTTFNEIFDNGGDNFNPATGQFTAPSSGLYQFHVQANFSATITGNAAYIVTFLKNGSSFAGNEAQIVSPPRDGFLTGISHTINLNLFTGETISVQVKQFSLEILSIEGGGSSATTVFSGFKVY
jgi:C1q domain